MGSRPRKEKWTLSLWSRKKIHGNFWSFWLRSKCSISSFQRKIWQSNRGTLLTLVLVEDVEVCVLRLPCKFVRIAEALLYRVEIATKLLHTGVVSNNSHPRHCGCAISQSLVRCGLFISWVRVTVTFNNSHFSRKSRTASYLAMRHIWHDTGPG